MRLRKLIDGRDKQRAAAQAETVPSGTSEATWKAKREAEFPDDSPQWQATLRYHRQHHVFLSISKEIHKGRCSPPDVPDVLRAHLQRLGVRQSWLARQCRVGEAIVSMWVNGQQHVPLRVLDALQGATGQEHFCYLACRLILQDVRSFQERHQPRQLSCNRSLRPYANDPLNVAWRTAVHRIAGTLGKIAAACGISADTAGQWRNGEVAIPPWGAELVELAIVAQDVEDLAVRRAACGIPTRARAVTPQRPLTDAEAAHVQALLAACRPEILRRSAGACARFADRSPSDTAKEVLARVEEGIARRVLRGPCTSDDIRRMLSRIIRSVQVDSYRGRLGLANHEILRVKRLRVIADRDGHLPTADELVADHGLRRERAVELLEHFAIWKRGGRATVYDDTRATGATDGYEA